MTFCSTSRMVRPSSFRRRTMRNISCTMAGREAERRLVEHDQPRLAHQAAADRQHLLLAAGQRAGRLAAAARPGAGTARTRARGSASPRARARFGAAPISRFSSTVRLGKTWRPSATWPMPASQTR